MLNKETIDLIVAAIVTTGGAAVGIGYGLNKLGLLHFGKKKTEETGPRNGGQCGMHKEVQDMLNKVKETQITNIQLHEQHKKELKDGARKFERMQDTISELREGVGILMDRSGGRPDSWRGNNHAE